MADQCSASCEDIKEIKADIKEIKADLAAHMQRTAVNEARVEMMEEFIKSAMTTQQENFKAMLQSNKDNQVALGKQLKIILGIFSGLATLLAGFAAFFK